MLILAKNGPGYLASGWKYRLYTQFHIFYNMSAIPVRPI